jgi:phosphatidylserine/phosphatidylglycerophosphate/cardiolipin synthase-like enzyme
MSFKRVGFFGLALLLLLTGMYHSFRAAPDGVSYRGPVWAVEADAVRFLADRTYINEAGERVSEQEIFDELIRMIGEAEQYILIDFFLFNDFTGAESSSYRQLTEELTTALVEKKQTNPDIAIDVITDPINTFYGGYRSPHLERMREVGIQTIMTDLVKLRDSNPTFSAPWRLLFKWAGNSDEGGWLPNPLAADSEKVTLRSYLASLNFKANHRKVALADFVNEQGEVRMATLITSANPHDGSSAHSNSAVVIEGNIWQDVYASEAIVAEFSDTSLSFRPEVSPLPMATDFNRVSVQLLTEFKIKAQLMAEIALLGKGDQLDMAMFYIADRDIVEVLRNADNRGVKLRLLFDPSKDAFGREKNGQPNRQVAHELLKHSVGNTEVRWCDTHGEQCHSKLTYLKRGGERLVILGSANLTRRNLDNYNLETNVLLHGASSSPVFVEMERFFDEQWNNEGGQYSVAYEVYADDNLYRRITYRLKEWSGLSRW